MALLKIPLLLLTLLSIHAGLMRPNPPPPPGERHLTNHITRHIDFAFGPLLIKVITSVIALMEISLILRLHHPALNWFTHTCRLTDPMLVLPFRVTTRFTLGCLLAGTGAAIRLWCYRSLGRFFTFELSLRPGHVLVTDGPYHYVRHPSYTGLFMLVLGFHLCFFGPGSFVFECGYLDGQFSRAASAVWVLLVFGICSGAIVRMRRENRLLRQHFGQQWEEWSRDVPCNLIPQVI